MGKELYRVRSGKLRVYTAASPQELGWLMPGDLVGEALLYSSLSPVNIEATEPVTLRAIPAKTLKTALGAMPAWMLALVKHLADSLRECEAQAHGSLVDDVPYALAVYLCHACRPEFQEAEALLDRFCWTSRLPMPPVQDTLKLFSLFQWVRTSAEGEKLLVRLENQERLRAFVSYRRCLLEQKEFPPFGLEKSQRQALPLLRKNTEEKMTEMACFSWLQAAIPALTLPHFLRLKELGLLRIMGEGLLRADQGLLALYEAALEARMQIEAVG